MFDKNLWMNCAPVTHKVLVLGIILKLSDMQDILMVCHPIDARPSVLLVCSYRANGTFQSESSSIWSK